jgi:hypothetical protein
MANAVAHWQILALWRRRENSIVNIALRSIWLPHVINAAPKLKE